MIYVRLMGGLGNQMFQYAFGRAVSIETHVPLRLDISFFDHQPNDPNFTKRSFELDLVSISSDLIVNKRLLSERFSESSLLSKVIRRFEKLKILRENGFQFQKELCQLSPQSDHLVIGYFQSEKYFSTHRKQILADFSVPAEKLSMPSRAALDQISRSQSVSVHVRRGDYVSSQVSQAFHGTCDLAYYRECLRQIGIRVKDPRFFIFSDDIEWCRKNLPSEYNYEWIDFNKGRDSYQDLILMKSCHHNVIANSSFSWWAAWLNENPEKFVLAPQKWFANSTVNTQDILPPSWIRISS